MQAAESPTFDEAFRKTTKLDSPGVKSEVHQAYQRHILLSTYHLVYGTFYCIVFKRNLIEAIRENFNKTCHGEAKCWVLE
jgi:hypothetical protein